MRFARTRVRAKRATALNHQDSFEYSHRGGLRTLSGTELERIGLPAVHVMEFEFPPPCLVSTLRRISEKNDALVLDIPRNNSVSLPRGLLAYRAHAAL